jgi:hypothetical protein
MTQSSGRTCREKAKVCLRMRCELQERCCYVPPFIARGVRDGTCRHGHTVIAREGGQFSTPRLLRIPVPSLEYWITRLRG